jgi:hypothetical protein
MWSSSQIGLLIGPQSVQRFDIGTGRALDPSPNLGHSLELIQASRTRLSVVLSDAYCRYTTMQRPQGLRSREELQAAAQGRFKTMFGDTESWRVQVHASALSQPDVVVGVREDILATLSAATQALHLKVTSIKPMLLAWANQLQRETRHGNHWIVSVNGSWASVAYLLNGRCCHIRALRVESEPLNLLELLARERAFLADTDLSAPVWLGAPDSASLPVISEGLRVMPLAHGKLWGTPLARKGGVL